jgi:hypothetical protein
MHIGMTTSRTRWLWLLLAASPAIFPLVLILRYGVDFPYYDEWDPGLAGMYVKAHQHQLTLADLLAQHNEHRIFIPRLVYLLFNTATHWNDVGDLLLGWAIVCATSACVLALICRTTAEPADGTPSLSRRALALWFLCNVMIFTSAQHENWLSGICVANFLPTLLVFLTLLIAGSSLRPAWKLSLCALMALADLYSSGNGILAWPLLILFFAGAWTRTQFRARRWPLVLATALFVLGVALYFVHYTKPTHVGHPPIATDPLAILSFYVVFMGGSQYVGGDYSTAMIVATCASAVMFLLFLGALAHFVHCRRAGRRDLADRMILWLVVAAFAILSGLIASLFRAAFGTRYALSSRYVSYSLYLPVALIMLVSLVCCDMQRRRAFGRDRLWIQIPAFLARAIIVMQCISYPAIIQHCASTQLVRRQNKAALMLVNVLPDNPRIPKLVYFAPSVLIEEARALSAMGYLHPPLIAGADAQAIRQTDPDRVSDTVGRLEKVDQSADGMIHMLGWAYFPHSGRQADAVFLTYENEEHRPIIFAAAGVGVARDDVAQKLGPDYQSSGWYAACPATLLPPQLKTTRVAAWTLNVDFGKAVPLDGVVSLQRPPPAK